MVVAVERAEADESGHIGATGTSDDNLVRRIISDGGRGGLPCDAARLGGGDMLIGEAVDEAGCEKWMHTIFRLSNRLSQYDSYYITVYTV